MAQPATLYTLLVFLYLPPALRLSRLRERERRLYGSRIAERGDMAGDHTAFMQWTEGYDTSTSEGTNTLRHHRAFAGRVRCPVLNLHSPMSTEEQLRAVLTALGQSGTT